MLINLLPGVRDLRTPLAVGYVLLITVYLSVADRLVTWAAAPGVVKDVGKLAARAGAGPTLAAV